MKILIVGIGALGGLIAARLTAAAASVSLATRDAESAARLKVSGLRVTGVEAPLRSKQCGLPPLEAYDSYHRFDLIVLATKAHDAIEVASRSSRACSNRAPFCYRSRMVACHRCLGTGSATACSAASRIWERRWRRRACTSSATTAICSSGKLPVEKVSGRSKSSDPWGALSRCAQRIIFRGAVWSKLLVNCSVTTIGAIAGCTMREFINVANGKEIFNRTYDETLSIALALGARPERMFVDPIPPGWCGRSVASEAHDAWIGQLIKGYGDAKPSMLQDIQRGRPTEIDFINGYVVSVARRLGVPAPLNAMIVETVHSITAGKITPNPALLGQALQAGLGNSGLSPRQ